MQTQTRHWLSHVGYTRITIGNTHDPLPQVTCDQRFPKEHPPPHEPHIIVTLSPYKATEERAEKNKTKQRNKKF